MDNLYCFKGVDYGLVFDTQNLNDWTDYLTTDTSEAKRTKLIEKLTNLNGFLLVSPNESQLTKTQQKEALREKIADLLMSLFEFMDFEKITEPKLKYTMILIIRKIVLSDYLEAGNLGLTQEQKDGIIDRLTRRID